MVEGAGDERPGADEARGWAGCHHASAGLSCRRGSRQDSRGSEMMLARFWEAVFPKPQ